MMSCDNRHASSWLIGESIRETYQGVGCEFCPKDIVANIRKQYDIQISYDKAWRARKLTLGSIRESLEESYNTLPLLLCFRAKKSWYHYLYSYQL